MNEAIAKGTVLVLTLMMVGFMVAIIFIPGALGATGEIVRGTITSAQEVIMSGVSKTVLK